ncbi:MAG: phosphatase PAP2 family protein [Phycisphaerales bacterium]
MGALVALAVPAHFALDERLARAAYDAKLFQSQVLQWTTELGESLWWLVPAGAVFAVAAWRKQHNLARWAFAMLAAVGASGLLVTLFKLSGRMRPKLLLEQGLYGFKPFTTGYDFRSFPSGHATTCGAAFMVLALAFPRGRWPLLVVGVAIASTRVAITAHYLSDILAGLALGMACALLTDAVWRRRWPASAPVPSGTTVG